MGRSQQAKLYMELLLYWAAEAVAAAAAASATGWLTVLFPHSRAAAAALEADLKPFPMRYYCAYDAVFDGPTQLNSDPLLAFV